MVPQGILILGKIPLHRLDIPYNYIFLTDEIYNNHPPIHVCLGNGIFPSIALSPCIYQGPVQPGLVHSNGCALHSV